MKPTSIPYEPIAGYSFHSTNDLPGTDNYLRSVFMHGHGPAVKPPPVCYIAKAPDWGELMKRITKDYYQSIEKRMISYLTQVLGREPQPDDILGRAIKMILPDGSIEYAYDGVVFLRIEAGKVVFFKEANTKPHD